MDPSELHRPWLAIASVSALLSPVGVSLKDIANWTDRGFVECALVHERGKRPARLFSLYSATTLHGINFGLSSGLTLGIARKLGQVCSLRLVEVNNPDETGRASIHMPADEVFSCWLEQEILKGAFVTPQELANEILRTGFPTPSIAGMQFDIDGLIETISPHSPHQIPIV